jgi:ribosome-associated protein
MELFMESRDLAKRAVISLDEHKAEDIKVISIRDLTVIADYFVIATGTSSTQVKALADYVDKELGEQGIKPLRVEGYTAANWILIDYGSMIVHIFYKETRDFYNLERLWKDGQQLQLSDFLDGEAQK